ncbi:alpha/beta fold hydrolase [Streptomyces sp. BG9H]|uniref:Alpha/beta fold hydrolase n=1 Tax=Streptomyces anatolicus TaxID=2675858 RepID=A0ABS6YGW2_9ACTN|nr:alpha/beta hydrolase [Streptomyces anatolicus]MBW5420646.1 alpha/beta fold hydrolase [Streptomyces anatolicus]
MRKVALLHGLGNNEAIWSSLAGHWRTDVEVYAPQLPWNGGGIADWRYETDSAALVEETLAAVPGGADLVVAHSFSSVLLLELLCRRAATGNPLDVPAVVLVNPFYRSSADSFHWDMIEPTLHDFPRTMAEAIRLQTVDRPIDPELRADMARRLCEWVGPYGWLRFFDTYLRTPLFRVDLVETRCLVMGGADDLSAPAAEASLLASLLPAAEPLIVPGGHFPMLERPRWFAETVQEFLDRTPDRVAPAAGI